MLKRRYDKEIMDDFSIKDERIDRALHELRYVNTFLGGKATTRKGFSLLRKGNGIGDILTVLDAGAGGADVFDDDRLSVTAVDINPRSCGYLRRTTKHSVVCADAEALPFPPTSFDVVHASLFLHHFPEAKVAAILKSFSTVAGKGIIINDLRRSVFAYAGITLLTRLFSKSTMVKHDGPLSVLRGFTKNDLIAILKACGFSRYIIRRTWAFRWLVVIFLS